MKRVYRDRSDVMIAGVCSGIGKYLEVDPTAIRLVFVLLTFAGLSGLWIYLILWIIMPMNPEQKHEVVEVEPKVKPHAPKKVAAPASKTTVQKSETKKPVAKKVSAAKPAAKKAPAKNKAVKKGGSKSEVDKKSPDGPGVKES